METLNYQRTLSNRFYQESYCHYSSIKEEVDNFIRIFYPQIWESEQDRLWENRWRFCEEAFRLTKIGYELNSGIITPFDYYAKYLEIINSYSQLPPIESYNIINTIHRFSFLIFSIISDARSQQPQYLGSLYILNQALQNPKLFDHIQVFDFSSRISLSNIGLVVCIILGFDRNECERLLSQGENSKYRYLPQLPYSFNL